MKHGFVISLHVSGEKKRPAPKQSGDYHMIGMYIVTVVIPVCISCRSGLARRSGPYDESAE